MNDLLWWLGQNALTVAILIPLVALACRWFRDRPAVQHLLWLVVLVKFITPPVVAWPWSADEMRAVVWRAERAVATAATIPAAATPVARPELPASGSLVVEWTELNEGLNELLPRSSPPIEPPGPQLAIDKSSGPLASAPAGVWQNWAAGCARWVGISWLVGVALSAVWQFGRITRYALLVRSGGAPSEPLAKEVTAAARRFGLRPPRAVISPRIRSPFVWCLGPLRLVWPLALASQDEVIRSRGVVAHELAHLRRGDHWVAWLELIAGIVWWWNPLFWLVRRRLREAAEMSCDALAISVCPQRRREYAELLLEFSSGCKTGAPAPVLAVSAGAPSAFERRLRMILSDRVSCKLSTGGILGALALALFALPGWSSGQQPPDLAPPPVTTPPPVATTPPVPAVLPIEPKAPPAPDDLTPPIAAAAPGIPPQPATPSAPGVLPSNAFPAPPSLGLPRPVAAAPPGTIELPVPGNVPTPTFPATPGAGPGPTLVPRKTVEGYTVYQAQAPVPTADPVLLQLIEQGRFEEAKARIEKLRSKQPVLVVPYGLPAKQRSPVTERIKPANEFDNEPQRDPRMLEAKREAELQSAIARTQALEAQVRQLMKMLADRESAPRAGTAPATEHPPAATHENPPRAGATYAVPVAPVSTPDAVVAAVRPTTTATRAQPNVPRGRYVPAEVGAVSALDLADRYLQAVTELKLARSRQARIANGDTTASAGDRDEAQIGLEQAERREQLMQQFVRSAIEAGQAGLEAVKAECARAEEAVRSGVGGQQDVFTAQARLSEAKARVQQLEAILYTRISSGTGTATRP